MNGAGVCQPTDDDYDNSVGYRVIIYDGKSYAVGYHCRFQKDGFTEANDANKTRKEIVKLESNYWSSSVLVGNLVNAFPLL